MGRIGMLICNTAVGTMSHIEASPNLPHSLQGNRKRPCPSDKDRQGRENHQTMRLGSGFPDPGNASDGERGNRPGIDRSRQPGGDSNLTGNHGLRGLIRARGLGGLGLHACALQVGGQAGGARPGAQGLEALGTQGAAAKGQALQGGFAVLTPAHLAKQ